MNIVSNAIVPFTFSLSLFFLDDGGPAVSGASAGWETAGTAGPGETLKSFFLIYITSVHCVRVHVLYYKDFQKYTVKSVKRKKKQWIVK